MAHGNRVLIAGAGIGGLALAHGLRSRGIDVAVHERDAGPDERWSGYRLHLTAEANRALHACLPLDNYLAVLHSAAAPLDAFRIVDESLTELLSNPFERPSASVVDDDLSIGRRALRELLLVGLEDVVQWGSRVERYRPLPDGGVRVVLGDGTERDATLLVGADGRSSRVRRQLLPHAEPQRSDTVSIAGTTSLEAAARAGMPAELLRGAGFAVGPHGRNVFLSVHDTSAPPSPLRPPVRGVAPVLAEPPVLWAVGADAEKFGDDPRSMPRGELRTAAAGMLEGWDPAVRAMVEAAAPDSCYPLTFWSAPRVEHWQTVPSVTLLGDAVHVMPPTGGIGASTALRDAAELARTLGLVEDGLAVPSAALHDYEVAMLQSGFDAVDESTANLARADRLDGPVAFRLGKWGMRSAGTARGLFRTLADHLG